MKEPYYQHGGMTIYHGDCREVVPALGQFELLLTDPPYGIGDRMKGGTWGAKQKYADLRGWDVAPEKELMLTLIDLAPRSIIWGGNYFSLPPSRSWLVWDKKNAVPTMADCELAWSNLNQPVKRLSLPVGKHSYGHPTEKPLQLFSWCIQQAGSPATIIDPFMGSGTTLRSAKDLGHEAVGIEIEEQYCEIAARRLSQEVFDFGEADK